MVLAFVSLFGGVFCSVAAGTVAILNCFRFRSIPPALGLSVFAVVVAGGTLAFEVWRLNGQWD